MKLSDAEIEEFIKKHSWWWRLPSEQWVFDKDSFTTINTNFPRKDWKYGVERASWRYELLRRQECDANLKPFFSLTDEEQDVEVGVFGGKERELVRDYIPPRSSFHWDPKSWFHIDEKEWNLHAPDDDLSEEFIKLVREERTTRRIREPKKELWREGKSPSWRWPELLDLRDKEKLQHRFDESDRKLYRRAVLLGQKLAVWWVNQYATDGM